MSDAKWHVERARTLAHIKDERGGLVCSVDASSNYPETIVRSVNAHASLVAALEGLVERGTDSPEHQAAERALKLTRGEA